MKRKITITIDDSVTDEEAINAIWHHIGCGKISHKNGNDFYPWATLYDLTNGDGMAIYTSDRSKSPNAAFVITKHKRNDKTSNL